MDFSYCCQQKSFTFFKNWQDKISNIHQLGGIETSILDNGYGKGVRIAWVNTGSGLRYKVVLDRAMDIADSFFNQFSLSWISKAGVSIPSPAPLSGNQWLNSFGGGLMVTCGLAHIGPPELDEYGSRGLHGNISNQPAEVISIIQPSTTTGDFGMSISGIIKESCIFGPHLELRRTISSTLGESVIRIHDEVTNTGNEKTPHMILYHCNFGWPLIDSGTMIFWDGSLHPGGSFLDKQIFYESGNYKICPEPLETHNGKGETVAFIDLHPNSEGKCTCGLINNNLNLSLFLRFYKKQLPWLINWQHWGKNEYVTGLEPATNPPSGQANARKDGSLIYLEPGESRIYDIEISVYCTNKS